MKKYNRIKAFAFVFITTVFSFLTSSCVFFPKKVNQEVQLSIRVSFDDSDLTKKRSAIPSTSIDASDFNKWTIVAKKVSSSEQVVLEWKEEQGVYNGNISVGDWEITAQGFLEDSKQTKILQGKTSLTVKNGGKYSALVPVRYLTEGTGELDLNISFETSLTNLKVEVSGFNDASLDTSYTISGNSLSLQKADLASGSYNVLFKFYDSEALLFAIRQTINIRDNTVTDKWLSSGEPYFDQDENLKITDDVISFLSQTQVFVKGSGGTIQAAASDENSGSYYAPLASMQKALDKIAQLHKISAADEYTIFVDGKISGDKAKLSYTESGLELNIEGLNGNSSKDILDATNATDLSQNPIIYFNSEENDGNKLIIYNLGFTGGKSSSHGGAICMLKGWVSLDRCNFKQNTANKSGGAIYVRGFVDDTYSVFEKNKALDGQGGAIYVWHIGNVCDEGNLFNGSQFIENEAKLAEDTTPSFANPYKEGSGGAVAASNGSFTECTFTKNSAELFGGALAQAYMQSPTYNPSDDFIVKDCTMTENYIKRFYTDEEPVCGGAIALDSISPYRANFALSGKNTIQNNWVYLDANSKKQSNLFVPEGMYIKLERDFSGEGMVGFTIEQELDEGLFCSSLLTSGFSQSAATKAKPGISSDEGFALGIILSDGEIVFGKAHNSQEYKTINYLMNNLSFDFDKSQVSMAADASDEDKIVTVTPKLNGIELSDEQKSNLTSVKIEIYSHGEFTGYSLTGNGDSDFKINFGEENYYWIEEFYQVRIKAVFEGSVFSQEKPLQLVRAIVAQNPDVLRELFAQKTETSVELGFASYMASVDDYQTLTLANYSEDALDGDAKLLYNSLFEISGGKYTIKGGGATITSTSSQDRVFAVRGAGTELTIENVDFTSTSTSKSTRTKGKCLLVDKGAKVTLKNCKVQNFCSAGNGIIEVVNGTLILENCEVTNNKRSSNYAPGGTINIWTNGSCTIKDSKINSNTSEHWSAGISCEGQLRIYDSEVCNNSSQRATGISASGTLLEMKNVTVSGNSASSNYYSSSGAGLWVKASDAYIENCTFTENNVSSSSGQDGNEHCGGAAIYVEATTLTVKDCTITNNQSGKYGGAFILFAQAGTSLDKKPTVIFEGTNNTISDNTASNGGNTCYVSSEIGGVYNGTSYDKGASIQ